MPVSVGFQWKNARGTSLAKYIAEKSVLLLTDGVLYSGNATVATTANCSIVSGSVVVTAGVTLGE